jgi:uncharacterized protein YciI
MVTPSVVSALLAVVQTATIRSASPCRENSLKTLLLTALAFALLTQPSASTANPKDAPPSKQEAAVTPSKVADPELAQRLGADVNGMRKYVLVILKTGPKRVPDGPERSAMFKGHFDNMNRLAKEGKLAVAGPFGDNTEWRGLFILAVDNFDAAKALVATDPVIKSGEMVAEYHTLYSSAALMAVSEIHQKIAASEGC